MNVSCLEEGGGPSIYIEKFELYESGKSKRLPPDLLLAAEERLTS